MHYQIHKEILCLSSKVVEEDKFDLLIYSAVIHLMFGAKYDELIDDVRDMRNRIFLYERYIKLYSQFQTAVETSPGHVK